MTIQNIVEYSLRSRSQTKLNCYAPITVRPFDEFHLSSLLVVIRESPQQFENQIMARVYVRSITRRTKYQKAPFCEPELAYGKLVL